VCCGAAKATFLGSIGTVWVFSILEVEAYLVESFFGDKVIVLTKVSAVDDGINKFAWI
jgi:hypothetical protein